MSVSLPAPAGREVIKINAAPPAAQQVDSCHVDETFVYESGALVLHTCFEKIVVNDVH